MNTQNLNGWITTWRAHTATSGAGEPVLTLRSLTHSIRCESVQPSDRRVQEARAQHVELARLVLVRPSALRAQSITATVGDRVNVRVTRPIAEELDLEITATRPRDDGTLELSCAIRRDGQ